MPLPSSQLLRRILAAASTPFDKLDFDAARRDFDVNTLGAMRVAQAFMPNVEHSKQRRSFP